MRIVVTYLLFSCEFRGMVWCTVWYYGMVCMVLILFLSGLPRVSAEGMTLGGFWYGQVLDG